MTNQPNPIDRLIEHIKTSQAYLTKLVGDASSIYRHLPYPQLPPGQLPYPQLPPGLAPLHQAPPVVAQAPPSTATPPMKAAPAGGRTSNPFEKSLYQRSAAPHVTTRAPASMSGQRGATPESSNTRATTEPGSSTARSDSGHQGGSTAAAARSDSQQADGATGTSAKSKSLPADGTTTPSTGGATPTSPAISIENSSTRYGQVLNVPLPGLVKDASVVPNPDTAGIAPTPLPIPGALPAIPEIASPAPPQGFPPLVPVSGIPDLSRYAPDIGEVVERMQRGERP